MTYKKEKAQGIVEYALLLAFVVGVALALFNSGGLADALDEAYFQVSKAINTAMDNTTAGRQRFAQNQLEKGLKDAIQAGKIVLDPGAWVEIDLTSTYNSKVDAYANGGKGGSVTLADDPNYKNGFSSIWKETGLTPSKINLDEEDRGTWAGVRIERSATDDGKYQVYYYHGTTSDVYQEATVPKYYYSSSTMNDHFGTEGYPQTWTP